MGPLPIILGGAAILLAAKLTKKAPVPAAVAPPALPVVPVKPVILPVSTVPVGSAKGATSQQIACVQTQLGMIRSPDGTGYAVPIDGQWNAATSLAIAKYQKDLGLPVNGSLDASTRLASDLSACFAVVPQLKPAVDPTGGATAFEIQCLQRALNNLYNDQHIAENGAYNGSLASAISRYQSDRGLETTGYITPDLLATFACTGASAPPAGQPASPGATVDMSGGANQYQIQCLQSYLGEMYQTPIGVDGVNGPQTQAAIRRFQGENDLPQTGIPQPEVLDLAGCATASNAAMAGVLEDSKSKDLKPAIDATVSEKELLEFAGFCLAQIPPRTDLHDYALARIVGLRTGQSTQKVLNDQALASRVYAAQGGSVEKKPAIQAGKRVLAGKRGFWNT